MKPAQFEYHAPRSVSKCVELLSELGDDARVLAGGQSLIPMLSMRLATFAHLIDVGRVDELSGITEVDGDVVVGAGTRDCVIERDPMIARAVPLLSRATPMIGHFQIRNRGTVGGSLAHADPAAEYPAVAIALDAEMDIASLAGRRTIAAADFFEGLWTTSMRPDEVLVAARFPIWTGRCGFAVKEFARRHGDFAVAGAVAGVQLGDDDRLVRSAIAVFGVSTTPVRAKTAERALVGSSLDDVDVDEVGRLAMSDVGEPMGDNHGSPEYRRRVGAAMVADAVRSAFAEAADG